MLGFIKSCTSFYSSSKSQLITKIMSGFILEITTIIILFACTLLAFFLLTVKTNNRLANILLGIYFLVFSIHISAFFYARYITLPVNIELLRDHIAFLSSPLLYLYVVSSIYSDFRLKLRHLVHLIPFLLQILLFLPRFYMADNTSSEWLLANLNDTFEGKASIVFGLLVVLFYLVAIYLELKKYKQLLVENFANKSIFNYDWLNQLFMLLVAIFCLSVIKQIYQFLGADVAVLSVLRILLTATLILFLSWVVLKSMYFPDLFRNINANHLLVKDILGSGGVSSNKSKPNKEIEELLNFMDEKEPYLDATLTIQKLADMFGTSNRNVSLLINHCLNQHFFDFVNSFRVKKAKHLLMIQGERKLTIQRIMYDVGFNSKSSFYSAFKKQVGITPSEYRNRII